MDPIVYLEELQALKHSPEMSTHNKTSQYNLQSHREILYHKHQDQHSTDSTANIRRPGALLVMESKK